MCQGCLQCVPNTDCCGCVVCVCQQHKSAQRDERAGWERLDRQRAGSISQLKEELADAKARNSTLDETLAKCVLLLQLCNAWVVS